MTCQHPANRPPRRALLALGLAAGLLGSPLAAD